MVCDLSDLAAAFGGTARGRASQGPSKFGGGIGLDACIIALGPATDGSDSSEASTGCVRCVHPGGAGGMIVLLGSTGGDFMKNASNLTLEFDRGRDKDNTGGGGGLYCGTRSATSPAFPECPEAVASCPASCPYPGGFGIKTGTHGRATRVLVLSLLTGTVSCVIIGMWLSTWASVAERVKTGVHMSAFMSSMGV